MAVSNNARSCVFVGSTTPHIGCVERLLDHDTLHIGELLAINCHDATLLNYAGVHASSWAILNGEKEHGVGWHVMSDIVEGAGRGGRQAHGGVRGRRR